MIAEEEIDDRSMPGIRRALHRPPSDWFLLSKSTMHLFPNTHRSCR